MTERIVVHGDYADSADFTEYRKVGTTRISNRRFPPGTVYDTPEGFVAEDEETRCAVDVQGGIYPIRESVFRSVYVPVTLAATPAPLDVERLARALIQSGMYLDAEGPLVGLDTPRDLAAAIAAAYAEEADHEQTGTVARGPSPRGLPEHSVSDVPSGSRPPRPPAAPKDREWDGS